MTGASSRGETRAGGLFGGYTAGYARSPRDSRPRRRAADPLPSPRRDSTQPSDTTAPAPGGAFRTGDFADTPDGPLLTVATSSAAVALEDARELGWSRLVTCRLESVALDEDDDEPLLHRRGRWVRP